MPRVPAVTANEVIKALGKVGFQAVRQKGVHVRMKHENGRALTVLVHAGKTLGIGLLNKILRNAELTQEEFINLLRE